jgi:hypothetical protein
MGSLGVKNCGTNLERVEARSAGIGTAPPAVMLRAGAVGAKPRCTAEAP